MTVRNSLRPLDRPFQLALDNIRLDRHLLDAALLQKLLELAVRQRLDLPLLDPPALKEQQREHGQEHVPDVDLLFLVHRRTTFEFYRSTGAFPCHICRNMGHVGV